MRTLEIINKQTVILDDEDYEKVSKIHWFVSKNNYAFATIKGKVISIHKLVSGFESDHENMIDHINGNPLDNRKSNLRLVTASENRMNARKITKANGTTSRFKGVFKKAKSKRWSSQVKGKHIGYFDTEEEAAKAYDVWAKGLSGGKALLNFN